MRHGFYLISCDPVQSGAGLATPLWGRLALGLIGVAPSRFYANSRSAGVQREQNNEAEKAQRVVEAVDCLHPFLVGLLYLAAWHPS